MSTILKTAAMTLLSKTLQTFLYKYLLDVDVEGVAMPSLYDGESGWGVRLSNLRLREGIHLMDLPGKRNAKNPPAQEGQNKTDDVTKERESDERKRESENKSIDEKEKRQNAEPDDSTIGNDENSVDGELDICTPTRRGRTDSFESVDSYLSSRPSTPPSSSSNMFGGCFHSDSPVLPMPSLNSDTPNNASDHDGYLIKSNRDGRASENITDAGNARNDKGAEIGPLQNEKANTTTAPVEQKTDEESNISDEKETDDGQEMALRLGVGGRIGTLDVRFVNKELRVLVEDAFLVVEVVPKSTAGGAAGPTNKTTASGESQEEDKAKTDPKGSSSAGDKSKSSTTGDRVMEKNGIAKLFSSIPQLFLRDCRIRLVVRNEEATFNSAEAKSDVTSNDTVVEVGVELLSVTNGEDFLANFRSNDMSSHNPFQEETAPPLNSVNEHYISSLDGVDSDQNDYLIRRIRTGKGPDGGISMRIFPPSTWKQRLDVMYMFGTEDGHSDDSRWALHSWMSSQQMCFLRCSGLDLQARIYLGKKEEVEESKKGNPWYGEESDEYTMDTTLYGVDYVPPPYQVFTDSSSVLGGSDSKRSGIDDASRVQDKSNGVQSLLTDSVFYKVARGLKPSPCQFVHLPCEHCSLCWGMDDQAIEHALDAAIPMPGIVLNLTIKEPLEINVDRSSLEVLGLIKTLFMGKESSASRLPPLPETNGEAQAEAFQPGMVEHLGEVNVARIVDNNDACEVVREEAFPNYMQPEAVAVTGVHLVKLILRVHAMRSDGRNDRGLSFCYWDMLAECVTLDHQRLSAPEQSCEDLRFDIALFHMTEYKGTGSKQLMILGVPQQLDAADNEGSFDTRHPDSPDIRSPWPSTASALLGASPLLETMMCASRERHGLQMRYISVPAPEGHAADEANRSLVDMRIGTSYMDLQWAMKDEISTVVSEMKKTLLETKDASTCEESSSANDPKNNQAECQPSQSSVMKYKVRMDGGHMNMQPKLQVHLPLTVFTGERSTDEGFYMHTLLDKVDFAYGKTRENVSKSATGISGVFVTQLASLPESARMRILFCLDDLDPLERALGVKKESNSFHRCRTVNKGLVRLAKKISKAPKPKKISHKKGALSEKNTQVNRRQELLAQILKLDNSGLEELLVTHQKLRRRGKLLREKTNGSV